MSLVALPYQVYVQTGSAFETGALGAVEVGPAIAVGLLGGAVAAWRIGPQPPHGVAEHPPIRRSIAEGLRFVRANKPLLGSFVIDLNAMTFGMPRALFPVLAVSVFHAGAAGTGVLFAAVSAG